MVPVTIQALNVSGHGFVDFIRPLPTLPILIPGSIPTSASTRPRVAPSAFSAVSRRPARLPGSVFVLVAILLVAASTVGLIIWTSTVAAPSREPF